MVGLHGEAASSAGWAWFGGGSLAAGGGGMALSHVILPGIGTAVAVTVSAGISHSEANKIAKKCEEIEAANKKNSLVLSTVRAGVKATNTFETKLVYWNQYLAEELKVARTALFRFGPISWLVRMLRYLFRGVYYNSDELLVIDRLGKAVERFLSQFQSEEK